MPRVFISHRAVEADLALARSLSQRLQGLGHSVFLAGDSLKLGESWPERIAAELGRADALLLLLSPQAAASEMVIEEVRQARQLRREQGRPAILPVRVGEHPGAPLPYDLAAYVGRIQQMAWFEEGDTQTILGAVLEAIDAPDGASQERAQGEEAAEADDEDRSPGSRRTEGDGDKLQDIDEPSAQSSTATRSGEGPLQAAGLATPASVDLADLSPTLGAPHLYTRQDGAPPLQPPGAPYGEPNWFVSRPKAEAQARAFLAQPGSPVVLVGPYQSGKSYLLHRLMREELGPEDLPVLLHLDALPDASLATLESLLFEIGLELCEATGIDEQALDKAWARPSHPVRRLRSFVGRRVLPSIRGRLLLALDRADAIMGRSWSGDFFGLLRAWASRGHQPPWDRFRLLAAVSTEPSLLVQDASFSPFNLSTPIRLRDFEADDVQDLARRHQLPWGAGECEGLMGLVGGQPYLVRLALFQAASQGLGLDAILEQAEGEHGPFSDHLRSKLLRLRAMPKLAQALRSLVANPAAPVDYLTAHRLVSAGMIQGQQGDYRLRYPLYERFFPSRI